MENVDKDIYLLPYPKVHLPETQGSLTVDVVTNTADQGKLSLKFKLKDSLSSDYTSHYSIDVPS